MKSWILLSLVSVGALAPSQVAQTLTVRVSGSETKISGAVVGGRDMVALSDVATLLGAQIDIAKMTPTDRIATLTLAPEKTGFDDGKDTVVTVDSNTAEWIPVAGSNGKMRIRDFVRGKDSWVTTGELEVAKNSILIQGRPPRDLVMLGFYVVLKDAANNTMGRKSIFIKDVSPEGGRYPISIALDRGDGNTNLPAWVGIRFNGATEDPMR